jgi:hypothetical protein
VGLHRLATRTALLAGTAAIATIAVTSAVSSCNAGTGPIGPGACKGMSCEAGSVREAEVDAFNADAQGVAEGSPFPNYDGPAGFSDGWTQAPWAAGCTMLQPGSPSVLSSVPTLTWETCPSGRSGCRDLVRNWGDPNDMLTSDWSVTASPAGVARLSFLRDYAPAYRERLVWDDDQGVVAAWRFPGDASCASLRSGDLSDGLLTLTVAHLTNPTTVSSYVEVVGAPSELLTKQQPDYSFCNQDLGAYPCPTTLILSQATGNDKVIGMYFDAVSRLTVRDAVTGKTDPLKMSDGGLRLTTPAFVVTGTDILYSDSMTVYLWRLGIGETPLISPPDNFHAEHDVASDGSSLVWVESSGYDGAQFHSSTLYTIPYPLDSGTVAPRALAAWVCPAAACGVQLENGYVTSPTWAATSEGGSPMHAQVLVVRLNDGATWQVVPDQGLVFGSTFVVNNELWLPYTDVPHSVTGIQRILLSALGTPGP